MKMRFMLSALLLSGFGISQLTAMEEGGQVRLPQTPELLQNILTPKNGAVIAFAGLTYKNPEVAEKVFLGGMAAYGVKKASDEFSEAKKPGFKNKLGFAGYTGMALASAYILYNILTK